MNPLDFYGPEFLLFYVAYAAVTIGVARWWVVRSELRLAEGAHATSPTRTSSPACAPA